MNDIFLFIMHLTEPPDAIAQLFTWHSTAFSPSNLKMKNIDNGLP